jgi:drug/metabolite transporter (DMT)-like permease
VIEDGLALSALAAVALGVSTVLLAVAARRIGTVVATSATLVLALVPLGLAAALTDFSLRLEWRSTLVLLCAGALVAVAYLAAIESFRLGPVAITSPIGSSAGAGTVAAAFVLLGERPTAAQWAAVVITAVGVVLASLRRTEEGTTIDGPGPIYAVIGVVLGSVANALVRDPVRDLGPLEAIITQRTFTVLFLAAVIGLLAWRRVELASAFDPRSVDIGGFDRRIVTLLLVLGAVDALAFVAFAYALLDAPAWLVGLVSQSGRALAVIGGIVLFAERPSGLQWTGIALLGAGLAVLSVAA